MPHHRETLSALHEKRSDVKFCLSGIASLQEITTGTRAKRAVCKG
jgi:hypothetical protein